LKTSNQTHIQTYTKTTCTQVLFLTSEQQIGREPKMLNPYFSTKPHVVTVYIKQLKKMYYLSSYMNTAPGMKVTWFLYLISNNIQISSSETLRHRSSRHEILWNLTILFWLSKHKESCQHFISWQNIWWGSAPLNSYTVSMI